MSNWINKMWYNFLNYLKEKKLIRPLVGRIVGGVCRLISNKTGIDVTIIRVLWIISPFITFGTAIFIYILCMLIIPSETFLDIFNDSAKQNTTRINDDYIDVRSWEKK